MAKVGRPRLEISEEEVFKLAKLDCTLREMADFLGCNEKTLRNNFSATIAKGKTMAKISLRRKAWHAIEKGNVAVLIFMMKAVLGYSEKQIIEHKGLKPLVIERYDSEEKLLLTTKGTESEKQLN